MVHPWSSGCMIFSILWHSEIFPSDWKSGLPVPVNKRKGINAKYSNYCAIALLLMPGKLFTMPLLKHATSYLFLLHHPPPAGFIPGQYTIEQTHTIRQLVGKTSCQIVLNTNGKRKLPSLVFDLASRFSPDSHCGWSFNLLMCPQKLSIYSKSCKITPKVLSL